MSGPDQFPEQYNRGLLRRIVDYFTPPKVRPEQPGQDLMPRARAGAEMIRSARWSYMAIALLMGTGVFVSLVRACHR